MSVRPWCIYLGEIKIEEREEEKRKVPSSTSVVDYLIMI